MVMYNTIGRPRHIKAIDSTSIMLVQGIKGFRNTCEKSEKDTSIFTNHANETKTMSCAFIEVHLIRGYMID